MKCNNMKNTLFIVTLSILLVAIVIELSPAITGKIIYALDDSKPVCVYITPKYSYIVENIDTCCQEIKQQSTCDKTGPVTCYIIYADARYELNNRAWNNCNSK